MPQGVASTVFSEMTVSSTALNIKDNITWPSGDAAASLGDFGDALIEVQDQPVRARWDGVDPTASVGHLFAAGDRITLSSRDAVADFRVIKDGATDATLAITLGPRYK